jgi:hypothetical protein
MKMVSSKPIVVFIFLILFSVPIIEVHAHSMFNSAESTIGNYRVQIATLPEIPSNGEPMQILFRVTDLDYEEVDGFTMGVRVFYNDIQIDAIAPQYHQGGHWETDYILEKSGIHIFRVDLYDVAKNGGVLTYTFNISTQNPFGYAFIFSIAAGSLGLAATLCYIYIPRILKSRSKA